MLVAFTYLSGTCLSHEYSRESRRYNNARNHAYTVGMSTID